MSYYIAKSVSINKKNNKITICCADSSLRPLYFRTTEYCKNKEVELKDKIIDLFVDIMDGNIKLYKSCKDIYKISEASLSIQRILNNPFMGINLWDADRRYGTNLYGDATKLVAEHFCYKQLMGTFKSEPLLKLIQEFTVKTIDICAKKEKELEENNIIIIDSAIKSSVFLGYDVFTIGTEAILAPEENYENNGRLDNSKDDAIFFGPGSVSLFHILSSGRSDVKNKSTFNSIMKRMKYKPKMAILPYEGFPAEELGFEVELITI